MASIASPRIPAASGTSTPTASSRRTSLDTQRTLSPARAGPPNAASGRRNRAALRDYYNLKPPSTGLASPARAGSIAETASVGSTTEDGDTETEPEDGSAMGGVPMGELDAPGFNPEAYVARTLEREGLAGVLRAAGALVNEIRELDGERKALVYDNYSKLIHATDTIKGMRANVITSTSGNRRQPGDIPTIRTGTSSVGATDADDTTMSKAITDELRNMVDRIAAIAQDLAGTAADKKGKVKEGVAEAKRWEEVERKKRQKHTVRWVVESPTRFRKLVREGNKVQAEEEWKDVQRLLDKWKGVQGVEEVRRGCVDALKEANDREKEEEEDEESSESGSESRSE